MVTPTALARSWEREFIDHVFGTPLLMGLLCILVLLVLHFAIQYVARGIRLRLALAKLTDAVLQQRAADATTVKAGLGDVFRGTRIEFGWLEYEETLHEQHEWKEGEKRTVAIRATVPAQAFINVETVVDPRIGSEYFKHLPGILTGLGIIGTFFGLIHGLQNFDPTSETAQLTTNLQSLFTEVKFAFTFSGIAIGVAILITAIEKWLYSACAKWVGELTQALDGLFRAGVGEEYLSGLLQASQESASQTRQLKESLVEDLKSLLTNLTDRQVAATRQMTADFGSQLERSLQQPLQSIAETVRLASGHQGEATSAVLQNLMSAFMAQMRESVGGQMDDLGALLRQSAMSMTQMESSMRSLVEDMHRAGSEQSEAASGAIRDLVARLNEHQQQRDKAITSSTQVVMDKLQTAVSRMAEAQEDANRKTQESVAQSVGAMQMNAERLSRSNASQVAAVNEATAGMHSVTTDAFSKLSAAASGVERAVSGLGEVAERMTALARHVAALETQAVQTAQQSNQAAAGLAAAGQALSGVVAKLNETAIRFEAVSRVTASEVDARAALLGDLRQVAIHSRTAASEFTQLTDQVKSQLSQNIDTFGTSVGQALTKHLLEYQKQLGDAVSMLKNALEELSEYADSSRS
jgi:putative membrane protein